jgi:hypothetical protein
MKLISSEKNEKYHEIVVEKQFLWFKWKVTYRQYGNTILRYKKGDYYYSIGYWQYLDIKDFFEINN